MSTALDLTIPGPDELGPKMLSLVDDRHRRFVWAMLHTPDQGKAAAVAGYSTKGGNNRVKGCLLMQRADILAALHEVGWKKFHGAALKSIFALEAIVDDPAHPKHLQAVLATLDRTGFAAQTEHKVTVEHSFSRARMDDLARRLAADLGIDPAKLIGVNSGDGARVVDVEVVAGE